MKIKQCQWSAEKGWEPSLSSTKLGSAVQVVLLFGGVKLINANGCMDAVRQAYPGACLFGCSTAGEIHDTFVRDDTIALTALALEHTQVVTAQVRIDGAERSFEAGQNLARQFDPRGLRHVFVLSEGLLVNASELVNGMNSILPADVKASGGCAGDGNRMQQTFVWCNGEPQQSAAVALGFYGDRLRVGSCAIGGWSPFGPDRVITKSKQHVLYEVDGRPALALYKQYLGRFAEQLPASGLLFPLELHVGDSQQRVLRAILAVNEADQSITFAGNVPEGSHARFMVGHIEDLIEGTHVAAKTALEDLKSFHPQLSILVSCNGRRFVLKQRVEEEIEAVRDVLGDETPLTGFYSYGEIAPAEGGGPAELHNETMTITAFAET